MSATEDLLSAEEDRAAARDGTAAGHSVCTFDLHRPNQNERLQLWFEVGLVEPDPQALEVYLDRQSFRHHDATVRQASVKKFIEEELEEVMLTLTPRAAFEAPYAFFAQSVEKLQNNSQGLFLYRARMRWYVDGVLKAGQSITVHC